MSTNCGVNYITSKSANVMFTSVRVALYPGSSTVEKRGGAWVLLLLKESQSDAVELKPWMTIADLYCRLTVKFIHIQSMNIPSTSS